MNRNDDFNQALRGWLHRQAPSQSPDRVLDSAIERVANEPQRRGWLRRLYGGWSTMLTMRTATVAAVVAVAAIIGIELISNNVGNTPPQASSPTPSPSQAVSSARPANRIPAMERLEAFLAARIAGFGAEGYVEVFDVETVPLLYATSTGAPYERYEVERVDETFSVRLFADDGATVVEQEIHLWNDDLTLDVLSTTENGRPVVLSYTSSDGEVTVSAPPPWRMWWPAADHLDDVGVWFGVMELHSHETETSIGFVDPVAYDAWCLDNGGTPVLVGPANARAIAQLLIADPDFETTAPVETRIGGIPAVSLDVTLRPRGQTCGVGMIEIARWIHALDEGKQLRLYLLDLPEGMSVKTLAITVVAPKERFEAVIEEAAPIIDSIEFGVP